MVNMEMMIVERFTDIIIPSCKKKKKVSERLLDSYLIMMQ